MQASAAALHAIAQAEDDRALAAAFRAYVATATICLVIATAAGLLLAFKFGAPDFWATQYLTFGRLRPRRFHRPTPIMPVIRPFPDVDQRRCVPRHLRSGHATPAWRHVWCTTMKRCGRAGESDMRRQAPSDPRQSSERRERRVDEQLAQSFPASDPPSWVLGTSRPPL